MRVAASLLDSISQAVALGVGRELEGHELVVAPGMTWSDVRRQLEPGRFGVVPRSAIVHPRDAGAVESIGLPRGQSSDWRFPPESDCKGLHVQAFGELWEAHVDQVHPDCSVIQHARKDAPQAWVGAGMAGGALLGLAVGRPLVGTMLGGALGLITLPKGSKR